MLIVPVIGIIIQKALEAAFVGAIIGGLVGGGAAAVGEVVTGVQTHGEINDQVVSNALHSVPAAAAEGAVVGAATGAVAGGATAAFNLGRAAWAASNFRHLPKAVHPAGYSYGMIPLADDAASIGTKLGRTIDPSTRLAAVSRDVGMRMQYAGIMYSDDAVALERSLHQQFAKQNISSSFGQEYFRISPTELASAFAR